MLYMKEQYVKQKKIIFTKSQESKLQILIFFIYINLHYAYFFYAINVIFNKYMILQRQQYYKIELKLMEENMIDIKKIEASLWDAADQLRANSKLTASEYSMPVLGLIFLRYAYNRFLIVKEEIEERLPSRNGKKRPVTKEDFESKSAIFLPEIARYDYLVNLTEDSDIGKTINEAMKAIENEYEKLRGSLSTNYTIFDNELLRELIRKFDSDELRNAKGDVFGRIYEYFLNKFAMTGAQEGGEFFTPISLVQMIVNVIEPEQGIVLDQITLDMIQAI
eukprot:TRINITY_DN22312_c0_g1_i1.p2 TRINITY_DN22312_c0_g1~~TRINITY_DN22312_c0_g1_i1.p2  ORF type:complete len:278 (-),score=38.20 TRINITY_DN22312_c0_g1_i1:161-994(-)